MQNNITTKQAKEIVRKTLNDLGVSFTKLTARTIGFVDLTREKIIFVKIYGWKPNPILAEIKKIAKKSNLCIETDWPL